MIVDALYSGVPWFAVWVLAVALLAFDCARREQGRPVDWLLPYVTVVALIQDVHPTK